MGGRGPGRAGFLAPYGDQGSCLVLPGTAEMSDSKFAINFIVIFNLIFL